MVTFFRLPTRRWQAVPLLLATGLLLAACQAQTVSGKVEPVQPPPPPPDPVLTDPVPTPSLGGTRGTTLVTEPAPPPEPEPVGPRLVAFLAPLSGPEEAVGKALLNASQLAFFDLAGPDLEVRPYDTGGTAIGAEDAVRRAVADRAALILGPLFSTSTQSAAPFAQAAGVPMISFSNNSAVAGNGVFTMGFTPGDQVRRVVLHAAAQGIRKFAALLPDTAYGRTASRSLTDTLLEAQSLFPPVVDEDGVLQEIEASEIQFYDPEAEDFASVVRAFAYYDSRRADLAEEKVLLQGREDAVSKQALKRLEVMDTFGDPPYEAVLLADASGRLQVVAPLLPFYDVDPSTVRMLGTLLWDDPVLAGEPSLAGGWYAAPDPKERTAFLDRYNKAFGQPAPEIATLAYDAMALAAALDRFRPEDPYGLDTLTMPDGFAGVDGLFRLTLAGVAERGLAVKEFRRGDRVIIDPAPVRFAPPLPADGVVVN